MSVESTALAMVMKVIGQTGSSKADLVDGKVPISELPPAAIERMVTVSDDTARFALTTATVQLGDTVKVTSTNKMYMVVDVEHLDSETGYEVYVAGRAAEAVADEDGNNIKSTYAKISLFIRYISL